jgi:hypothetical protein
LREFSKSESKKVIVLFFVVVANRKKDLLLGGWNSLEVRKDIFLFEYVLYVFGS